MNNTDSDHRPANADIEIQFTEGFTGQTARLFADDKILASPTLWSDFQTGLAHIEFLKIEHGKEVRIEIGDLPLTAVFSVEAARPFVTVALDEGELHVASKATRPGYL